MRAAARAYLASHPALALFLVIFRWILWFCIGHPVGVAVAVMALRVGVSLPAAALAGLILDFGANLFAAFTDGWIGRRFRLVTLAARFQRRWPSAIAEASQQRPHDRPVILSGRYFAAPDGLRPVLTAPRVHIKPLSITETAVTWEVRPWSAQSFGEFSIDVELVALADDKVAATHLTGQPPSRRRRWNLTVQFFESAQRPDSGGGALEGDGRITPGTNGGGPSPTEPPHAKGRSANGSLNNGGAPVERNGSGWLPHKTKPMPRPGAEI